MQVTVRQLRQIVKESLQEKQQVNEGFKEKLKLIPLLAFALVSNACNQDKPDPHRFHLEGFTETEIQVIEDAADEWCEKTLGEDCVTFGEDGDSVIKLAVQADMDYVGQTGKHNKKMVSKTSTIKILDQRDNPDWLNQLHILVRHEMGHHLQNIEQELAPGNAVSEYTDDASPYITDHDVESLKADHILDPDVNKDKINQ
jgi:hypothetical protein